MLYIVGVSCKIDNLKGNFTMQLKIDKRTDIVLNAMDTIQSV